MVLELFFPFWGGMKYAVAGWDSRFCLGNLAII